MKSIFKNETLAIQACKHGYFAYNPNDTCIGHSLEQYGEWCEGELDLLQEVINEGDVILDIGANIGTHTVFFAKQVGLFGKVLAFEPQRLIFQMLCTNLALNNIYNTESYQVGVSDKKGRVHLPIINPDLTINFGAVPLEGHHEGAFIPVITLDSLKLERCNLIKIDVEGMEAKVLKGASRTIKTHRPTLYVENNTTTHSQEILQALHDLEYDSWWHFVPYFNPKNTFQCPTNDFLSKFESNLICFPKEQHIKPQNLLPTRGLKDNYKKAFEAFKA